MTASKCTFIRLLADEEKGAALADSIRACRGEKQHPRSSPSLQRHSPWSRDRRSPTGSVTGSGGCSWSFHPSKGTGGRSNRVLPPPTISDLSGHGGRWTLPAPSAGHRRRHQMNSGRKPLREEMGAFREGWRILTILCRHTPRGELEE